VDYSTFIRKAGECCREVSVDADTDLLYITFQYSRSELLFNAKNMT